ncbi:MAG: segregation and condensation protein B [Bacteriovoracaceae bacterium]|jgi:segregation and condensation protein B
MSVIDYSWDFSKEDFSLDLDFFNEKEQEDKLWQARTGLNHETLCGAIETIIFMNDKPINLQKIKNQIDSDIPLRVIHESIARLQTEYEQKHHGIRLMEVAQGYQFRTKATYSKVIQNMFKVQSLQLSPTALEVLAIIAYKQPISKTKVESIRGVDSSHIVRALMDRRLVKMAGRSDEAGRPSLYATTTEFLEVFNLNSTDDLPSEIEIEELANANDIGKISDIKSIVQTGEKKIFDMDELHELDLISSGIKDIASDTLFTKSLKDMDRTRKTEEGVEKKSAFDILEEYVNKAQIIEQNRSSTESEVLTSVMNPRTISLALIKDMLFNTPEVDESDELDIEVELEEDGLLDMASEKEFEELDSSSTREIEAKADEILERSEELIEALVNDPEGALAAQTSSLEDEVDAAFDFLMSEDDSIDETVEDVVVAPKVENSEVDPSGLDISSFISAKIAAAGAQVSNEVEGIEEESKEEESEEVELANALDAAFANLTGEELVDHMDESSDQIDGITADLVGQAKDLDIDLDFLQSSLKETNDSNELDQ